MKMFGRVTRGMLAIGIILAGMELVYIGEMLALILGAILCPCGCFMLWVEIKGRDDAGGSKTLYQKSDFNPTFDTTAFFVSKV